MKPNTKYKIHLFFKYTFGNIVKSRNLPNSGSLGSTPVARYQTLFLCELENCFLHLYIFKYCKYYKITKPPEVRIFGLRPLWSPETKLTLVLNPHCSAAHHIASDGNDDDDDGDDDGGDDDDDDFNDVIVTWF